MVEFVSRVIETCFEKKLYPLLVQRNRNGKNFSLALNQIGENFHFFRIDMGFVIFFFKFISFFRIL